MLLRQPLHPLVLQISRINFTICIYIQGVSGGISHIAEELPYANLHRYNQKHLYIQS